eukprot:TRINITY_DN21515_c0_g1_i1.p1 TRINITY_DN21515_c0_g1~~TRINITY_DN21515_c0_g1_i1.p1  ORF type:complete len:984 (+),score=128.29 TRINITY_DN21515_c0_g1_i1:272-2953(+)
MDALSNVKTWQFFRDIHGFWYPRPGRIRDQSQRVPTKLKKEDLVIRGTGIFTWEFLDASAEYYGSKLTFYFSFMSFYTGWLRYLLVFAIAWMVFALVNDLNKLVIWNLVIVVVWGGLFVAVWDRKSSELAYMWGTRQFDITELPSAKYITKHKKKKTKFFYNPLTGEEEPLIPKWVHALRVAISWVITLILLAGVVILMVFILEVKTDQKEKGNTILLYIITAVSATVIVITNKIYNLISVKLTNFEDQRTLSQEEDSLIVKNFIFAYFNTFTSLVYVLLNDKDPSELRRQLLTQLIIQALVSFFLEKLALFLTIKWGMRKTSDEEKAVVKVDKVPLDGATLNEEEKSDHAHILEQCFLPAIESYYTDYNMLALQYALATHFAVVLPIAPVLAFLLNLFELWTDKWKFRRISQRPVALQANDIGVWGVIFYILTFINLPLNALAMVILIPSWEDYVPGTNFFTTDFKEGFFITGVSAVGLFILWVLTRLLIPSTAKWVREQELLERISLKQKVASAKKSTRRQHHQAARAATSIDGENQARAHVGAAVYKRGALSKKAKAGNKRPGSSVMSTSERPRARTPRHDQLQRAATGQTAAEKEEEQELLAEPIVEIPPVYVEIVHRGVHATASMELQSISEGNTGNGPDGATGGGGTSGGEGGKMPRGGEGNATPGGPPAITPGGGGGATEGVVMAPTIEEREDIVNAAPPPIDPPAPVHALPPQQRLPQHSAPPPDTEPAVNQPPQIYANAHAARAAPRVEPELNQGDNPLSKEFPTPQTHAVLELSSAPTSRATSGYNPTLAPTKHVSPPSTAISVALAYQPTHTPTTTHHYGINTVATTSPPPVPITGEAIPWQPSAWGGQALPPPPPHPGSAAHPHYVPAVRHPGGSVRVVTV